MTDELFFDTDCFSAFLWINNTNLLQKLYSGRIKTRKILQDEEERFVSSGTYNAKIYLEEID